MIARDSKVEKDYPAFARNPWFWGGVLFALAAVYLYFGNTAWMGTVTPWGKTVPVWRILLSISAGFSMIFFAATFTDLIGPDDTKAMNDNH